MYYDDKSDSINFDPEFAIENQSLRSLRLRVENITNHLHFNLAQAGLSPTQFQADTYPPSFRHKISVIHDGVDTDHVKPNPDAVLQINDRLMLTRQHEVITFVNRNLEPYRGYHVFMRSLPELLRKRPKAQIVILGSDGLSYGARPPEGQSWKKIYIDEVRGDISDQNWQRVHFLGRVPYDTFLSALQVSRVHIYLTYPFVLSWSLIEAMSAECAIIASDTAPVKEIIKQGKTGVLVDFFNQKALVNRIDALLGNPRRRAKLGVAASSFVVANYDLQSCCLPAQLDWVDQLAKEPLKTVC